MSKEGWISKIGIKKKELKGLRNSKEGRKGKEKRKSKEERKS